ncbi:MAG: hypothetical protein AB2693_33560 [Candidatus Thiodiazotropha sp.]
MEDCPVDLNRSQLVDQKEALVDRETALTCASANLSILYLPEKFRPVLAAKNGLALVVDLAYFFLLPTVA